MFEVLVESAAPPSAAASARILAVSAHLAAILAAAAGAHAVRSAPIATRESPMPLYVATDPVSTGSAGGASPISASTSGAPVLPDLPTTVPSTIPVATSSPEPAGTAALRRLRQGLVTGPTHSATSSMTGVLLAGEVDEPAAVLSPQAPVYPPTLASAGITGRVSLSFVVDTLGRAEEGSIRILSSTLPSFEEAARTSVAGTTYRPARSRGQRVRQLVQQSVLFRAP